MSTTPELTAYIEEQKKAGFSRTEIEQALRASGWNAADIAEAFGDVPPTPQNTSPSSNSPQAFLAEMERRREAAKATQSALPQTSVSYTIPDVTPQTTETGIIGFLIKNNIAKTKQQANMILIGVIVVVVGITLWYNFA